MQRDGAPNLRRDYTGYTGDLSWDNCEMSMLLHGRIHGDISCGVQ